jgi:hypothetical protein
VPRESKYLRCDFDGEVTVVPRKELRSIGKTSTANQSGTGTISRSSEKGRWCRGAAESQTDQLDNHYREERKDTSYGNSKATHVVRTLR